MYIEICIGFRDSGSGSREYGSGFERIRDEGFGFTVKGHVGRSKVM